MQKNLLLISLLATSLSSLPLIHAAQPPSHLSAETTQHKQAKSTTAHSQAHTQTDGERVFAQNCSRCHAAPEGFPPEISGTVVRHMRVRASLSAADEQALLRFLNP